MAPSFLRGMLFGLPIALIMWLGGILAAIDLCRIARAALPRL